MHVTTLDLRYVVQEQDALVLIGRDRRTAEAKVIRISNCSEDAAEEALACGSSYEAIGLSAHVTFRLEPIAEAEADPSSRVDRHDA